MKRQLDGLVVFRELLRDEAVAMFREVLQDRCRNDGDAFTTHCGEFVFRLFQQGDCWTEYLRSAVMESENVCIRNWASGTVTALQERCLDRELAFLDQLSQVTLADLTAGLDNAPAFLEGWRTEPGSIAQDYRQRMQEVGAKGYGIFARYHMFTVENGQVRTATNHCGGILGGITDGMPLTFRAAFKPTPSIAKEQQSVNLTTLTPEALRIVGRHDPCIVPRAVPCIEAAAAIAVYDALLGGN